jgi:hypothetical protein
MPALSGFGTDTPLANPDVAMQHILRDNGLSK